MNIRHFKIYLKNISKQLKDDLFDNPYLFITEADFQAWLYNQLHFIYDFSSPLQDYHNEPISKIHLEYPRFRKKGNALIKQGRYDIVILRKPRKDSIFDEQYRTEVLLDYFPSYIAFELKAKWSITTDKVLKNFLEDITVFSNSRNLSSDFGVLFHLNLARPYEKRCDYTRIQKTMKRHKKKNLHVLFIYLESYHSEDQQPPKILYAF